MRPFHRFSPLIAACAFSLFSLQSVMAEQVKLEGVHLCCGMCVKAINQTLTRVSGVSDIKVSQDDETVSFEAKDKTAIEAGLKALTGAGFYGKSSHPVPDVSVDANARQDEIEISGLHLCCPGCTNAAQAALKEVAGVKKIVPQTKQRLITISGENISLAETLKALHESGFHGTLK